MKKKTNRVKIAIIGEYNSAFPPHATTINSIMETADRLRVGIETSWIGTKKTETSIERLKAYDGIWISPGSPYESLEGALNAVRYARENNIPVILENSKIDHNES